MIDPVRFPHGREGPVAAGEGVGTCRETVRGMILCDPTDLHLGYDDLLLLWHLRGTSLTPVIVCGVEPKHLAGRVFTTTTVPDCETVPKNVPSLVLL